MDRFNWIKYTKWFFGGLAVLAAVLILTIPFALYISPKETPPVGALQHIKDRGKLLVALEPNTLNYYLYRGEAVGFGLGMIKAFSMYLQLPYRVIACSTTAQAWYYLDHHAVDIVVANLPVTRAGKNLVHFTSPLGETPLALVRRTAPVSSSDTLFRFIDTAEELTGDTVVVSQNLFFKPLYDQFLNRAGADVILQEVDLTPERLFRMVSEGLIRYTLCPENLAQVLQEAWPNTDISLTVSKIYPFAWALNHSSDSLLEILDFWIDSVAAPRTLKRLYRDTYQNSRVAAHLTSPSSSFTSNRLSPWDEQLRHYSDLFWWDWRLVASLMYTESNFKEGLSSHKSAWGLMQMIPETAEIYGLDTSSSASHQILAGVQYLRWIDKQLPPEITDPRERASFTLAAYNLGIGRVLSLRKKAAEYGKDPNRWHGQVEYYLLRQSHTDPHGYADTLQDFPVNYSLDGYVDGIINRYYHYLDFIPGKDPAGSTRKSP